MTAHIPEPIDNGALPSDRATQASPQAPSGLGHPVSVTSAEVGAAMSYPLSQLEPYDAGLLNDWGGGDVEWWQDYIRAELQRAHDHYQSQVDAFMCGVEMEDGWIAQNGYACPVDADVLIDGIIWREGGRHEWGTYIRAGDMQDRDWAVVAAYRIHSTAQAIEARRAETGTGSVEDESAVAKPCAQGPSA